MMNSANNDSHQATDWSETGSGAIRNMIRGGAGIGWLARVIGWAEKIATSNGAATVDASHIETGARLAGRNAPEADNQ